MGAAQVAEWEQGILCAVGVRLSRCENGGQACLERSAFHDQSKLVSPIESTNCPKTSSLLLLLWLFWLVLGGGFGVDTPVLFFAFFRNAVCPNR